MGSQRTKNPAWQISDELEGMLTGRMEDGPGDALRHALASAVLTQKYGRSLAWLGGNLNEWASSGRGTPQFNQLSVDQDDYNNLYGRNIGSETETPEEAFLRILDDMERSTNQETFYRGKTRNDMDTSVPVIWNRSLYNESPEQTLKAIQEMRNRYNQGMFTNIFSQY